MPPRLLVSLSAAATVVAAALGVVPPAGAVPPAGGPVRAEEPVLIGRAVLPALSFAPGPASGTALGPGPVNGVALPFEDQPVQGFSALIRGRRPGVYLALSDNGYGSRTNSADFLLRAHRVRPDFSGGTVEVLGRLGLSDPHGFAGRVTRADRRLTGADFDPESIRRVADGTYWVGEELGPSLLHFSAGGQLLGPPVRFPVPRRLAGAARGRSVVASPDAPEVLAGRAVANLPSSRGIEGMALSTDGRTLYPSLEGALVDDPDQARRVVYAFDVARGRFRPRTADLRLSDPAHAVGDLTAAGRDTLLVIERDNAQGEQAVTKQIRLVDISRFRGTLPTAPLVDLLDLANPRLVGGPEQPGTVGLGEPFAFPFQTVESVLVRDRRTLVVANDNNFPFSSGRRPGSPDDNEIIEIRLPAPLPRGR